jgi:hypothetical protein
MKEQSIIEVGKSRLVWESLEAFARQGGAPAAANSCWKRRSGRRWGAPATHAATA